MSPISILSPAGTVSN